MSKLTWTCKPFVQLSLDELYQLLAIRQEVFVVEQDCPYLDADGKDQMAWHLMGWSADQKMEACARLLPLGVSYPKASSIGRILTTERARGIGAGKAMMLEAMLWMEKLYGRVPITISAQTYLLQFYGQFGFQSTGKEYLEDGIPHTEMRFDYP
ncbi:MAG: GNAT family N-acetyltransferase [Bacteroidota bacterium]